MAALTLGATTAIVTAANDPKPDAPPRAVLIRASSIDTERCPQARKALEFWKQSYARWRARQQLSGPPATVRYDCAATERRASQWRARAARAWRSAVAWLRYEFDWRSWLPRNWYLLGSCETGYGGPPNWHHANGVYVSAFGISRREYDADAAYMGAPPWNDTNPPTPRQQYLAALGHYRRFGDGWGCPGP